ncbi:MAG: hypothetical protein V7L31_28725 [Nostoc sp.]|uniref:hypothetical protein n=1 Tax=Nostoc sp. TaxID=1180 RepID=UPI002FF2EE5A
MIQLILKKLVSASIKSSLKAYQTLSFEYGHFKTAQDWVCLDKYGKPIPWYTYPAIEYIKQLDFSDKVIFEYGSGYSSIFWAERCKTMVSIEDNEEWYNKIKNRLPKNVDYLLINEKKSYINSILDYNHKFDVIIIDGSDRYECAVIAREKLSETGIIVLDNSDWQEKASNFLRESNLIQVDMAGFGPINSYTWTTSFFFSRYFNFSPASDRQPVHGIGSLKHRNA